jgi:hypothetical protein
MKAEWKVPPETQIAETPPPLGPVPTYERQSTGGMNCVFHFMTSSIVIVIFLPPQIDAQNTL